MVETDRRELPLERELLRAASAECAPLAARRRALGALGLLRIVPRAESTQPPPAPGPALLRLWHAVAKFSLVVAIGAAIGLAVATASLAYQNHRQREAELRRDGSNQSRSTEAPPAPRSVAR